MFARAYTARLGAGKGSGYGVMDGALHAFTLTNLMIRVVCMQLSAGSCGGGRWLFPHKLWSGNVDRPLADHPFGTYHIPLRHNTTDRTPFLAFQLKTELFRPAHTHRERANSANLSAPRDRCTHSPPSRNLSLQDEALFCPGCLLGVGRGALLPFGALFRRHSPHSST